MAQQKTGAGRKPPTRTRTPTTRTPTTRTPTTRTPTTRTPTAKPPKTRPPAKPPTTKTPTTRTPTTKTPTTRTPRNTRLTPEQSNAYRRAVEQARRRAVYTGKGAGSGTVHDPTWKRMGYPTEAAWRAAGSKRTGWGGTTWFGPNAKPPPKTKTGSARKPPLRPPARTGGGGGGSWQPTGSWDGLDPLNPTDRPGTPYGDAAPRRRFTIDPTTRRLPSADDFGEEGKKARDAFYKRGFNLLSPEIDRKASALQTMLANRGIGMGGEAYTKEVNRNEREANRLLENLSLSAVEAGNRRQTELAELAARLQGQEFDQKYRTAGFDFLQDQNIADSLDRYRYNRANFGEGQRRFDLARDLDYDRLGFDRDRFGAQHALDLDRFSHYVFDTNRRGQERQLTLRDMLLNNQLDRTRRLYY